MMSGSWAQDASWRNVIAESEGQYLPRGSKYPIKKVLGFWVIAIIVRVLCKYMIIRYLDPLGYKPTPCTSHLDISNLKSKT